MLEPAPPNHFRLHVCGNRGGSVDARESYERAQGWVVPRAVRERPYRGRGGRRVHGIAHAPVQVKSLDLRPHACHALKVGRRKAVAPVRAVDGDVCESAEVRGQERLDELFKGLVRAPTRGDVKRDAREA